MPIQFEQLDGIISGKLVSKSGGYVVESLSIDSRSVIDPESTLFFAIKGEHHDGHKYLQELYNKGVRQFVVEKEIDWTPMPDANAILCNRSITALQELATHHRNQFDLETIGIAGSNGKTIVKEWLFQLLSPDVYIVKSPKSYNSQVGVPLSVWQIDNNSELGLFEAGISTINEMEKLVLIIQPQLGIFTNIGSAHNQGFTSEREKIVDKIKLFQHTEQLVYCRDHTAIHEAVIENNIKGFTWGKHPDATIVMVDVVKRDHHSATVRLQYKKQLITITLPFIDGASIENAMHCIAFLLSRNYRVDIINARVAELRHLKMRLELKQGINNCQLIDDTYINDLGGVRIALEFMAQQNSHLSKTIVVSDILQTGLSDDDLYTQLGQLFLQHRVNKVIGIGKAISKQSEKFKCTSQFFSSTADFLSSFNKENFNNELILVKGARAFSFEQIVNQLEQKNHGTVLEINLNALTRNLNFYRSQLAESTKLMVMVKAFAYGSGSDEVANLLQHHQVDYLGVAYSDEGIALRNSGITVPIMVMNPSLDSFDKLIEFNLEPEIYNFKLLKALINHVQEQPISIHLKIDTGMHRLGFVKTEIDELIYLLNQNTNIEVKSIFTHLAGADSAMHNSFSEEQINTFTFVVESIKKALQISPIVHVLNSAGILRFPQYQFDMVRLGVGLYGVEANEKNQQQLSPISTLKTVVSQIKTVKKGETIGYGRMGKATSDMKIATIAIGYADGYNRAFSNGVGSVYINGQTVPIIGNVCMDMTMIEIKDMEVQEGDEVEVFGKNISILKLAHQINTIPYEILTNVSNRVKRVFFLD